MARTAGLAFLAAFSLSPQTSPTPPTASRSAFSATEARRVLTTYCASCHNRKAATANLAIDALDLSNPGADAAVWEKVVQKLNAGTMPPGSAPKPDKSTYAALTAWIEGELDKAWEAHRNPGRINAVHRLNRQEYGNAIRDLLALDVDVKAMLPADATADGSFDNMANILTISPAHLDRYMSAARHISRLAVGLPPVSVISGEFGLPRDHLQEDMVNTDLPLGSRGGIAARYNFPVDGEYRIRVFLHRSYQDYILGMGWQQPLDVRLDSKLLKRFTVGGGASGYRASALGFAGDGEPGSEGDREWEEYLLTGGDANLEVRTFVKAGPRIVGVAFPRDMFEPDGLGNPAYGATGEYLLSEQYMAPARVAEVRIAGPYQAGGAAGERYPEPARDLRVQAHEIRRTRLRHAHPFEASPPRLPAAGDRSGSAAANEFFDLGQKDGNSFDAGIQMALERLLVDPDFLLRVYRDPEDADLRVRPAQHSPKPYRLSDIEVASRLSFFLWSSIPDEPLLGLLKPGSSPSRGICGSKSGECWRTGAPPTRWCAAFSRSG